MSLHKKILRTMREHKSQYIGAAFLVLFSCTLFIAFNVMGVNVRNSLETFKTQNVQEDAYFIVEKPLTGLDALSKDYDVLIEERWAYDLDYAADTTLRILSATDTVDIYKVTQGADLKNPDDMLIDPSFAKAHEIAFGDTIAVFGKTFTVVGFASTPDYIYPLKRDSDMTKNPKAFGIAVVAKADFPAQGYGYSFYSVKYQNTDVNAFKRAIEQSDTVIRWVDKGNNMRISFIEGDIKGVTPLGTVLPTAILLVTCALVAVVLWRLIKREYSQIGVLYALGFKKGEILRHYLVYPLIIAATGAVPGVVCGLLAVKPFINFISTFYNLPVYAVSVSPGVLAVCLLLPFALLLPIAWLVIASALRLSPLQLIKGGGKDVKINWLERHARMKRMKFSVKFKVREILRNIPRTLLMFLGVVCASALLLLGFSMSDSMSSLMENNFRSANRYQYIYTYNTLQTDTPETGERASLAVFKVVDEAKSETVVVNGMQKGAKLIHLTDKDGKTLSFDQTIITQSLADRYKLAVGDTLTVENTLNQQQAAWTVGAIAQYYLGDYVYMPLKDLNAALGVPADSYTTLYTEQKLDVPSADLVSVISRQYLEEGFTLMLDPIRQLSYMIGVISCVIGLIILYVVISLLIEENKDSISLLKVLGYGNKRLYPLILTPYTFLVIAGYLLSIPLILVSLRAFFGVMTADMSMSIPAKLSWVHIAAGFVIIFLTYELTKLLNRRKINRVNLSESMKIARE